MDQGTRSAFGLPLRLGTVGYVSCLAFSLAVGVLSQGPRTLPALVAIALLAAVFYPTGLRVLADARVWLLAAFLVLPMAFFGGPPDLVLAGVRLSSDGLGAGAQMAGRALAIIVGFAGFTSAVSVTELGGLLERAGLRGLGFAVGVAINMLPTVRETTTGTYQALWLRGGFRRQRLRALRLMLIAIVAGSLRHADDIVSAAEARAFSVGRARALPLRRRPIDLPVTAALFLVALALLLL